MLGTRYLLCVVFLGLLFTACAHAPNALDDGVTVAKLRQDYLKKNPNGQYNYYIVHGQVVKGMKHVEVMASWGLPESRRLSKDRKVEYWTFYGKDNDSWDWIRYTLEFEENVLTGWDVDRHYAKNGMIEDWVHRTPNALLQDSPREPASDVSALKR